MNRSKRSAALIALTLLVGCDGQSSSKNEISTAIDVSVPILAGDKNWDSEIDPKQITGTPISVTGTSRTGVVDCRAGCQGDAKKCQESVLREARIDSLPGQYFDASTLRISRQWNASDSPGLIRTPNWIVSRWPENSSHPTSIIIRPDIRTCEGRSKDTQGVTFYEFSVSHY